MKTRTAKLAERLRSSLWVVPAACTLVAALLAFVLVELDRRAGNGSLSLPGAFQGGAESARAVLSTIAGSMITVAGTIYSITIVVLTLASVQFAPRVLRSFIRDRSNQLVLGFFVATFTYCLLVLGSVRSAGETEFVPATAVAGGVALALASLGMLIYFIDHIFHGIQVSSIIATVTRETVQQINEIYPDMWHETGSPPAAETPPPHEDWGPVPATHSGYLHDSVQHAKHDDGVSRPVVPELVEGQAGQVVKSALAHHDAHLAARVRVAGVVELAARQRAQDHPQVVYAVEGRRRVVDGW